MFPLNADLLHLYMSGSVPGNKCLNYKRTLYAKSEMLYYCKRHVLQMVTDIFYNIFERKMASRTTDKARRNWQHITAVRTIVRQPLSPLGNKLEIGAQTYDPKFGQVQ